MSPKRSAESGFFNKRKLIAAGAGLALALGLTACSAEGGNKAPSPTETSNSQPTNPPKTEIPKVPEMTFEEKVKALEIKAGLSAERVGQTIIERWDSWQNAGTNDVDIYTEWMNVPVTKSPDFVYENKAEEYAAIYAEALYIDECESHEDIVRHYEFAKRLNSDTLRLNLQTSHYEGVSPTFQRDEEPFQRKIRFEDAREIPNDGSLRIIEIDYTEWMNADKNRVFELAPNYINFRQGTTGRYIITLLTVDGVEKISAITAKDL